MNQDGWKSRKLWSALMAKGLILIGFIMVGHPESLYGDFCMSILAASGLFGAANVVEKRLQKQATKQK